MEQRTLGVNGPQVSVIGLGCNNFGMRIDRDTSVDVVRAAVDAGVTHFDTAEMYGRGHSEEFLGEGLRGHRDEVVIATKFSPRPKDQAWEPGALAKRITEACETSLRRLDTDHINLYYQHMPDPEAPIDETLSTLASLVEAGKILQIASSNVENKSIDEAAETAARLGTPAFAATQAEWSLLVRKSEQTVVPAATRHHMGVVPFFPLASGMLTGKYRKGEDYPEGSRFASIDSFAAVATNENFDYAERLAAFAEGRGHTLLELAVAWLLAQPCVASVITGATTTEQVKVNAIAAGWMLDPEAVAAVPLPG